MLFHILGNHLAYILNFFSLQKEWAYGFPGIQSNIGFSFSPYRIPTYIYLLCSESDKKIQGLLSREES